MTLELSWIEICQENNSRQSLELLSIYKIGHSFHSWPWGWLGWWSMMARFATSVDLVSCPHWRILAFLMLRNTVKGSNKKLPSGFQESKQDFRNQLCHCHSYIIGRQAFHIKSRVNGSNDVLRLPYTDHVTINVQLEYN